MSQTFRQEARRRAKSNNLRPLLRLLPYLLQYKLQMICAVLALAAASGATLLIPIAVRKIVDNGFTASNAEFVNRYFLLMLVVVAVLAISSATRFYFVMWLGERVVADVRDGLFKHLLKLTPSFYESQKTGEVVSRLTADTTQIKSAFSSTASIALRNAVMLVGAISLMLWTSPKYSLLAALAIPGIVLPLVIYGRKVRKLSRTAQDTLADSAAFAQEHLSHIAAVQSNTREDDIVGEFGKATTEAFDAAKKKTLARAVLTFFVILFSTGAVVALLWFGARDVLDGKVTGGTLSQFVLYAVFAASSLGQLSEVWGEVQLAAGAAERISELLDEVPSIASPAPALAVNSKGALAFENVSFSYPARPNAEALSKVSFNAKPGEMIAIVGPSGGGKSTLFQLLQRFHDPKSGRVLLDGVDLKSFELESLRLAIATVPQEPAIFSSSVRDNIRFSKPDASDAEIRAAADQARVTEFATRLPQGFDTLLGERGVTLSGGQRQRVAIARAILRNAPVLLLDEATSALDAESEALIQDALEHVSKNRTTLVIAHRLATVRNADRIIVLEDGKIIGEGSHKALLKSSPLYAKLAKLQFTAPSA